MKRNVRKLKEKEKSIFCQDNSSVIDKTSATGITLVALVVTIVVLLILAGITITYVFGENGIFKLAQDAKDKTENAIEEEKDYINKIDNMVNEYMNGTGSGTTTPPTPEEPEDQIKSDWETIEKIAKEIAKDDSVTNETEKVTVTVDDKEYTINVGDIFEVKYNDEVRRVRVLGFKHDDLVDQTVYGGTHTKASISFEFLDFMTGSTLKSMNSSNTNSGGLGSNTNEKRSKWILQQCCYPKWSNRRIRSKLK